MSITKCRGYYCAIRDNCHRYTAIETEEWQSWADFQKFLLPSGGCKEFISNEGRPKDVRYESYGITEQVSGETTQDESWNG